MVNPDQNSTEAAMDAYMRQIKQFKEDGGEWSNRKLEELRNQSGLSEERAKLIEDQVFTRDKRETERERLCKTQNYFNHRIGQIDDSGTGQIDGCCEGRDDDF
jgi:hypothetical protein